MDKFLNQFRRIGYDDGRNDKSFAEQEEKLKISHEKLKQATQELVRASQRLNDAALGANDQIVIKQMH